MALSHNNGWIKLHRKLLDNPISQKSTYFHLWVTLLLKANHKDEKFMWNGGLIIIKDGQFVTGRDKLVKETGIPATTIERILKYLENEHQIGQQKTTKYRLITIVNWKDYQKTDSTSDNKRTTNGQQTDTNKNIKNDKKEIPMGTETVPDEALTVIQSTIDFWNKLPTGKETSKTGYANTSAQTKLLPRCLKLTEQAKKTFAKLNKTYKAEDYQQAIKKYVVEILNRVPNKTSTYYKHRFYFDEFFKQENGFLKFINNA